MSSNFTFASLPAIAAGLSNAEVIDAKFVYNFFTPDERINEKYSTFPVDGVTDQAYFASRIGQVPRYVKINFRAPNITRSIAGLPSLRRRLDSGEQIVFESAPFNCNFSAIEIADTLVDSRCYLISSASLNFSSIPDESGVSLSLPEISTDAIVNSRSLVFNSLGNIQSSGFRYARTDVREEVKSQYLRDVRAFWTGVTINNLLIGDIANQVVKDQKSIFADEFAAVLDSANSIQDISRQNSTPLKIMADAYDYTIPTNNVVILDADLYDTLPPPQYQLVGYVAQKFSQQADGTVKIYDDLIFDTTQTYLVDEGVRYGGIYSYQIRAVYNVRLYVSAQDVKGRGTGVAQVDMLFATAGSNIDVDCIETVPPQPPEDLYFKLENDASLFIGWRFPLNKQRDIKKFQIDAQKAFWFLLPHPNHCFFSSTSLNKPFGTNFG